MTLPVRLLVRTQADWRSMDGAGFAAQDDRAAPLHWIKFVAGNDVLAIWDEVFELPFPAYRADLQALASQTHARAGADTVSLGLDDLGESFAGWWSSPDDEVVVTVDDDDFFQPDLGTLREHFADGIDVVLWPQVVLAHVPDGTLEFNWAPMPVILQNNWAVRKSFLTENFTRPQVRQMLARHRLASDLIADHLGVHADEASLFGLRALEHASVRFIEPRFGLYNNHVGSISFLVEALRADDPVGVLRSLDFTLPAIPDSVAAMEPELTRLADLWDALARA